MRTAPPVSVHCSGGRVWRALQSLLPALAAAVFVVWLTEYGGWPKPQTAFAALFLTTIVAVLAWRAAAPRIALLTWDGRCWRVDDASGQLLVMMDLGLWMLLRLKPAPQGPLRWLAVSASEAGPAWHGLRAALHSVQPSENAAPAKAGPRV
jgi:hypothetical protein